MTGIPPKPESNRGTHPGRAEVSREMSAGEKPKRLTVDLDPELYRRLRVYAAEQDQSISDLVREELMDLLSGDK